MPFSHVGKSYREKKGNNCVKQQLEWYEVFKKKPLTICNYYSNFRQGSLNAAKTEEQSVAGSFKQFFTNLLQPSTIRPSVVLPLLRCNAALGQETKIRFTALHRQDAAARQPLANNQTQTQEETLSPSIPHFTLVKIQWFMCWNLLPAHEAPPPAEIIFRNSMKNTNNLQKVFSTNYSLKLNIDKPSLNRSFLQFFFTIILRFFLLNSLRILTYFFFHLPALLMAPLTPF